MLTNGTNHLVQVGGGSVLSTHRPGRAGSCSHRRCWSTSCNGGRRAASTVRGQPPKPTTTPGWGDPPSSPHPRHDGKCSPLRRTADWLPGLSVTWLAVSVEGRHVGGGKDLYWNECALQGKACMEGKGIHVAYCLCGPQGRCKYWAVWPFYKISSCFSSRVAPIPLQSTSTNTFFF